MAVEVHHSYCHQCIAVCGLLVSVDGDHIVSVRGDPDHVVTRGYTCSKGRAHGALHHAPDRLDDPQLRHRGRLVPVSWDDLLDDLADHVSRLISDVGPDAVGTYFGSLSGWDPAGRPWRRRSTAASAPGAGTRRPPPTARRSRSSPRPCSATPPSPPPRSRGDHDAAPMCTKATTPRRSTRSWIAASADHKTSSWRPAPQGKTGVCLSSRGRS